MLEWLKSAWASWRVRVAMVGGVIVVATSFGTCSFDPQQVSDASTVETETTAPVTEPVSEVTTTGAEETSSTTETTNVENSEETTETNATE